MATTPRGLKAAGRRLWSATTADFDLDESAVAQLVEACFTVDLLADLRRQVAEIDPVLDSDSGPKIHPLLVEIRMQRLALVRMIAGIGLPRELVG